MINRKAFLLNAIEEGFKNNVSGYPLTLKHSKGKDLLDYKVYGNSIQETEMFDKSQMQSGFLPQTGAYPTTNTSYPNATYQIIEMKKGQVFNVTYTGTTNGRMRYIDNDTNEVVGTIGKTETDYYTSTNTYYDGFTDGIITAKKDFKLGVMSLIPLTIGFNLSVKSVTPLPDEPIEIQSVGEKTKNLFDKNNPNLIGGYISGKKLNNYDTTIKNYVTFVMDCEPNTVYTVSRQLIGKRFVIASGKNSPATDISFTNEVDGFTNSSLTITTGETDKYLYVWFYNKQYDTDTYEHLMEGIQVEKGNISMTYEPYGYKIPVVASGKNLFNLSAVEHTERTEILENGIKWLQSGDVDIKLPAGKYTISFKQSGTGTLYLRNGKVSSGYIAQITPTSTYKTFTFDASVDGYLRISCFSSEKILTDIQIEEGTAATAYESYQNIGKNLFDKNDLSPIYISATTGAISTTSDSSGSTRFIPVKPNSTYVWSGFEGNTRTHFYDINKTWLSSSVQASGDTFTTPENVYYIKFCKGVVPSILQTYDIQLEEGAVPTVYEPYGIGKVTYVYLDEPLRKIGDYADYIDFKEQKVVRKINTTNLSAESVSSVGSNDGTLSHFYKNLLPKRLLLTDVKDDIQLLSNKLVALSFKNYTSDSNNSINAITYNYSNQAIFFKIKSDLIGVTDSMTNAEKKTKANEYLTSNPITVNYILENPIEKNIYLESIRAIKGTNIVTTDTTVEASNVNGLYKSFEKGE